MQTSKKKQYKSIRNYPKLLQVIELAAKNIKIISQAPVAHACNPNYSGGRDQEDHSAKLAQANSLQDPS
jgi:hypothetical protein